MEEKLANPLRRVPLTDDTIDKEFDESRDTEHRSDNHDRNVAFPQEIIDHILDQISPPTDPDFVSQKETLANCTLVCSAWLPRSSLHLFRCISISSHRILQLLERAKTSDRLRHYIGGFIGIYPLTVPLPPTEWLPNIFTTFPGIKRISFRYDLPDEAPDAFALCHPRSLSIPFLLLRDASVEHLPSYFRFFGRVDELVLANVNGDIVPVIKPPHVLTQSIFLDSSDPNALWMMRSIINPLFLTKLRIRVGQVRGQGMMNALDKFLGDAGVDIEHLSLEIGWNGRCT